MNFGSACIFWGETDDDSQLWCSVVMLMLDNACTQKKDPICPIKMPSFVVFRSRCVCVCVCVYTHLSFSLLSMQVRSIKDVSACMCCVFWYSFTVWVIHSIREQHSEFFALIKYKTWADLYLNHDYRHTQYKQTDVRHFLHTQFRLLNSKCYLFCATQNQILS